MTTRQRYENPASQAERLAAHQNDERVRKVAYQTIAAAEADAVGGRFAARERSTVIGSGPVNYPVLPASSPWANDPLPASEPLGFAIDEMEPVGTAQEIEQSLQALASQGGEGINSESPPSAPPSSGAALLRGNSSLRSEAAAPPPSKQKFRKRIRP
jgi:hypothetical protein